MATYSCKNAQRRSLILSQGLLNGIDFLEVLDSQAPAGITPQCTLLVHLLQSNATLTATNIAITGGVRTTSATVLWAYPATAIPATLATPAQQAFFAALPNANHILVVRTSSSGDFSTYTLSLVRDAGDTAPPAGFDPRLSTVQFSFKVECPSDFDCSTTTVCAQPAPVDLPIDYLAKDYASFRQLMLDRMAITIPNWTERSPADLGVAIVETLAYSADRLSYFQDAVATEAYLGTARRRTSVRRHAVLLDYAMHDGCNARAWVFLQVGPATGAIEVPGPVSTPAGIGGSGTLLLTQANARTGSLTSTQLQNSLSTGNSLVFQTMHNLTARSAHNLIRFYTWSDDACCLPTGSTSATLRNDSPEPLLLAVGDALLFEEVLSPITGSSGDIDASHRAIVRLTSVTANTDPYNSIPLIEITWDSADALPFPLCISASIQGLGGILLSDLSIARGNMVLADHGATQPPEPLTPSIVPTTGTYRPSLQQPGITFTAAYNGQQPAMSQLTQDPRTALPSITLTGDNSLWQPVRNLLNSLPFDRSFVVETEDDGAATANTQATLRFGDGELGALPESDLVATYRVGNGAAGNVGAESITNIALPGFSAVRNPLPAAGGTQPETSDQVRAYAPQAFRVQQRAVTAADYATLAQTFPQVQKAQAVRRWTGSWHTMFVTVERQSQAVDSTFETNLAAYLDPFRLIGYDVEVKPPIYVPLDIAFTVCVSPTYLLSNVEAALYQTFSAGMLPNGQTGFFNPSNFTFGQPVYLSQIVSRAMSVPGVQWVNTQDTGARQTRFQRWGYAPAGELQAGEIDFAQLEIAQLSNDPSAPENGRIQFFMTGGM